MVEQDIRRVVRELCVIPSTRFDTLTPEDDLFSTGLRSFDTVQIMLALEARFEIEFPDHMLDRANFATLGRIRSNVEQLIDGARAA